MIRVLIVDDHPFVRAGMTALLGDAGGIVVVGECSDGAEVPDIAPGVRPDVVVMDVQMPRVCGTDATRNLLAKQPTIQVLMVSGCIRAGILDEAAAAGAAGYLAKGDPGALIAAVRTVAGGGTAWPEMSRRGPERYD